MLWGKKNKNVINLNGVKRNITIQIFASHSHEEPRTNNCYIIYSENPFPFLFNCIFSFISMPTFPTFVFFVILSLFFLLLLFLKFQLKPGRIPNSYQMIIWKSLVPMHMFLFFQGGCGRRQGCLLLKRMGFGGLILEIRSCSC